MDALAFAEGKSVAGDVNCLLGEAYQVHLDAARSLVPHRVMGEAGEIEIRAKFAIGAHQQIEIEGSGNALCIVIGGNENPLALLQIDAEEKAAARAKQARGIAKEGARLRMCQIADGRAGEEAEPRLPPRDGRQSARRGEVGDQRQDGKAWMPPR